MTNIEELLTKRRGRLTPSSIWTFAKQETQFENVFKAACIFSNIAHPDSENIEKYFNEHDYDGFRCNHRMLSSAQLFGLVTKTGNRYGQETVTPVFKELAKYGIGSAEFNTIKSEQLLKIKMSAIIDRTDNINAHHIFPVFYIFDVLYALHQHGVGSITMDQLFSYVMTCESSDELNETVAILLSNPAPSKYVEQYKSDCRMWTLIEKNCRLFNVKNNRVFINPNYTDFFHNHFYMDNTNVVESILDSIVEYPDAYKKAHSIYQNLDIDITDDTPKVSVRFKNKDLKKDYSLQQIFYGAPGTGKSHEINEKTEGEAVVRTTFHPDSDYSTFVGSYKPTMKSVDAKVIPVVLGDSGTVFKKNEGTYKEKRIIYKFVMQAFLKAYLGAWKKYTEAVEGEAKPQFLVVEEINRGNCAQIFGDLFQLLDRGSNGFSEYPIETDTDLQQEIESAFKEHKEYKLTKDINVEGMVKNYTSNREGGTLSKDIQDGYILLLPSNLFIWATMNTSDQSLFPIDSAFKRRWDWKYMKIAEGRDSETKQKLEWKVRFDFKDKEKGDCAFECKWWDFICNINKKIADATSSDDKKLGYFFCKPKQKDSKKIDAETMVGKVVFYLWNDVFKDEGNSIFAVGADQKEQSFDVFYTEGDDGKTIADTNVLRSFMHKVFGNDESLYQEIVKEETKTE